MTMKSEFTTTQLIIAVTIIICLFLFVAHLDYVQFH